MQGLGKGGDASSSNGMDSVVAKRESATYQERCSSCSDSPDAHGGDPLADRGLKDAGCIIMHWI